MSAFLCDAKLFNEIAETLASYADQDPFAFSATAHASKFILTLRVIENDNGSRVLHPNIQAKAAVFARQLYDMNLEAISQRYEDGINDGYDYKYESCLPMENQYQLFANIRCLIYQCNEGDVPETDLFKKLEKICDALAYDIITETDEYKATSWG